jgi:cyclohexa-1,5-dienecarbonyl-CoA hydratase
VFASPSATFGQPELKLGVFAPLGTLLLPRIVGPRRAADLLLSGRSVGIAEAHAYGLASEVAADPQAAARAWAAEHLLSKSALSLRHATRLLRKDLRERVLPALEEAEHAYLGPLMATRDAREGIAAFLEKRNPVWEDR